MARKNTFQYTETISVNRNNFLNTVIRNNNLTKKDLRVCLHLLTHLDGLSFKEVSKKQIAYDLNMTKSVVSECIENLIDEEIIEQGSSQSVNDGYRLLF